MREIDGIVYSSRAGRDHATRATGCAIVRIRETVDAVGAHTVAGRTSCGSTRLDPATLEARGRARRACASSRAATVPETDEYVGSTVVMLGA